MQAFALHAFQCFQPPLCVPLRCHPPLPPPLQAGKRDRGARSCCLKIIQVMAWNIFKAEWQLKKMFPKLLLLLVREAVPVKRTDSLPARTFPSALAPSAFSGSGTAPLIFLQPQRRRGTHAVERARWRVSHACRLHFLHAKLTRAPCDLYQPHRHSARRPAAPSRQRCRHAWRMRTRPAAASAVK